MANEYHKWTAEDISTFWQLKDEGYTLAEISMKMGLPYTSVKSKSQELIKEKPDKTGQSQTTKAEVETVEAMKLQDGFKGSRLYINIEGGVTDIQILDDVNGETFELTMKRHKKAPDGLPTEQGKRLKDCLDRLSFVLEWAYKI